MSNYELQSRVHELERELNQIMAVNNELRNEIAFVVHNVSRADQQLRDYNAYIQNTLENCNDTMLSSTDKVVAAYELQGEIEKLYLRFKNIELANKKIRACNNKRYYDFGNYRTVRKIVQGLMDNLDMNLVSDRIITKSVEVKHLQVPDYWLTCVLISVMAWKNDDRPLADRAMGRAVSLDKKNSSIFYMLFNLRMNREEAALKWFESYQECDLKGSDRRTFLMLFSLISRTINEKVGEETYAKINRFINKVVMDNAKAEGYSEEGIISAICAYFAYMRSNDLPEYPLMKKYCPEFGYLAGILADAGNNTNILEFILKTVNVTAIQKNEYLKTYIDELIAAPNQVEKEVYEETAYNETVIALQGDVEAAKAKYEADLKKTTGSLELIEAMVDWIYEHENQNINSQVRLNMFTLTKHLQEKAVTRYVEEYRSRDREHIGIQISDYSTKADFGDEAGEKQKVSDHYNEKKNGELAGIKNLKAYIGFGAAAAFGVGAFFAGYWLFAFMAVGAGYGVYVLLSNSSARKQIELKCQNATRNASEILDKLFAEHKRFIEEYSGYDGLYDRIINEFRKI